MENEKEKSGKKIVCEYVWLGRKNGDILVRSKIFFFLTHHLGWIILILTAIFYYYLLIFLCSSLIEVNLYKYYFQSFILFSTKQKNISILHFSLQPNIFEGKLNLFYLQNFLFPSFFFFSFIHQPNEAYDWDILFHLETYFFPLLNP